MRLLLVITFLLTAGMVGATSNSSDSTPTKSVTKPKTDVAQQKGEVESTKLVTKKFPENIKLSSPLVTHAEAINKTEKAPDYFSSEWWLVYLNGILMAITGVLAFFTWKLYSATVGLGRKADQLNRQALVADQRPWVTCEIEMQGGLRREKNGDVVVSLVITLKNVGKSPALNIQIFPEIYAAFGSEHPADYQRKIAEREREKPIGKSGSNEILFPGAHSVHHIATPLQQRDIERADEQVRIFNGETLDHLPPIVVLGFVDYATPFDEEHHQTGFIYDLWRNIPDRPGRRAFPKLTEEFPEIPIDQLILVKSWYGSGFTN